MSRRRAALLGSIAALALLLATMGTPDAEPRTVTHRWQATRVKVYAPVVPGYRFRVGAAIAEWNANGNVTLVRVWTPCTGCIRIRYVRTDDTWAGQATVWPDLDGHIIDCRIDLQRRYAYRFGVWGVTAHEIGHCLGLPHTSYRPSVMAPRDIALEPTVRDVALLAALYG